MSHPLDTMDGNYLNSWKYGNKITVQQLEKISWHIMLSLYALQGYFLSKWNIFWLPWFIFEFEETPVVVTLVEGVEPSFSLSPLLLFCKFWQLAKFDNFSSGFNMRFTVGTSSWLDKSRLCVILARSDIRPRLIRSLTKVVFCKGGWDENEIGAADSIIEVIKLNKACKCRCFERLSGYCNVLDKALLSSVMKTFWMSTLCQYEPRTDSNWRASVEMTDGLLSFVFSVVDCEGSRVE